MPTSNQRAGQSWGELLVFGVPIYYWVSRHSVPSSERPADDVGSAHDSEGPGVRQVLALKAVTS